MRLRTRNLLLLLPLFVALGVGLALPGQHAVQREMDGSVRETAGALAVSIAEFSGGCPIDGDPRLAERLRQIIEFGQALEVALYDASGSLCSHAGRAGADGLIQGPGLPEGASPTDSLGVQDGTSPDGAAYVQGWAAVPERRPERGVRGPALAVVRIDASWMPPRQQQITRRFSASVLLIIALGLAAALYLSRRLERELEPLQTAAESIARRETDLKALDGAGVRETYDLAETLTTVAAVLRDALDRGHRRLREDPELDHTMLATLHRGSTNRPEPSEADDSRFAARDCGRRPTGHRCGRVDVGEGNVLLAWCAVVDRGNAVDDDLAAQAAEALIRRQLGLRGASSATQADLATLTTELRHIADLDGLAIARLDRSSRRGQAVTATCASVGAAHAERDGVRVLLDTLSPAGHREALRCLALTPGRAPATTTDFIASALAPVHRGTVCIVASDA